MARSVLEILEEQAGRNFELHEKYLNTQMVKVLRTLGFDRQYVRARGAYLFDDEGRRYLDLLSGYGVFAVGRNHPVVAAVGQELSFAQTQHSRQQQCCLPGSRIELRL